MVSVRSATIHITTNDPAQLKEILHHVLDVAAQNPKCIFEIGVTRVEEAP